MTDIHFGAKGNSEQHNNDCLRFVEWFCGEVRRDPSIDHVMFLGDWYENRSALNISTMNFSYQAAKMLNDLGMPIFFIVGNHDLYHKHTRDVHSVVNFHEFSNFTVIDAPVVIENIGDGGAVLSPYLFHSEYPSLAQYLSYKTWWGHFEFQGFVITGYNVTMPTGPKAADFAGPTRIFSGHFHKRQMNANVVYIGNTFPTNFGDAGDMDRGMAVYDHMSDNLTFINWPDAPAYIKTSLSDLMDEAVDLIPGARVKCVSDIPLSLEESLIVKQTYVDTYKLREFTLEESSSLSTTLTETDSGLTTEEIDLGSVDELVIKMISSIKDDQIDNQLLVDQFKLLT